MNRCSPLVNASPCADLELTTHKGHQLQFRFENFNAFNHPNWNAPSTDARATTFGKITSARTMRELQFGLKYVF